MTKWLRGQRCGGNAAGPRPLRWSDLAQGDWSATSRRIRRLSQRTWTMATRRIPPGLSTLTSSPARWPEIAAPKGESSEIR